jgi:3-oxoacyl-[acyl-carrier protein] reductase
MPDPDLSGLRVTLTGHVEPELRAATSDAFASVGCELLDTPGGASTDIAVVFARRASSSSLLDADAATFAEHVERELLEPQRSVLAAARSMADTSSGAIVLVGSIDLFHAYPGRTAASVAMGGLLGLVRSIAVELAGRGVRSNLVVAGPLGREDGGAPDAPDAAIERTLLRSPSHRFARPSEVAAAIRFVAGPDAAFMTGQTLRVDGGWASLNQAPEGMRFP